MPVRPPAQPPDWRESPAGRGKVTNLDARVAELAARQHGVVARHQLIAVGLSTSAIDRRRDDGRLVRMHRGVYA